MAKKKMKWFDWVAYVLLVIAALNWGLVAFFDYNAVTMLSFGFGVLEMILYGLVFTAGVYGAIMAVRLAK